MVKLTIACMVTLCVNSAPDVKRDYPTKRACDRALIQLAKDWRPSDAWTMNCVRRK